MRPTTWLPGIDHTAFDPAEVVRVEKSGPRMRIDPLHGRGSLVREGDLNSDFRSHPQSDDYQEMPAELDFYDSACQPVSATSRPFLTVR